MTRRKCTPQRKSWLHLCIYTVSRVSKLQAAGQASRRSGGDRYVIWRGRGPVEISRKLEKMLLQVLSVAFLLYHLYRILSSHELSSIFYTRKCCGRSCYIGATAHCSLYILNFVLLQLSWFQRAPSLSEGYERH